MEQIRELAVKVAVAVREWRLTLPQTEHALLHLISSGADPKLVEEAVDRSAKAELGAVIACAYLEPSNESMENMLRTANLWVGGALGREGIESEQYERKKQLLQLRRVVQALGQADR